MGEKIATTLPEAIREHASNHRSPALRFLSDGEHETAAISYAELDRACRATAAWLQGRTSPGDRVLVAAPSSIELVVGILGAWYAGCVAVPAPAPERLGPARSRLHAIGAACEARALLTTSTCLPALRELWPRFDQERSCDLTMLDDGGASSWRATNPAANDVALVQYTSGSTGQPKGIVIEHRQLVANEQMIASAFGHDASTVVVGWLPLHHDMGLIGNVLQPLFIGGVAIVMPPSAFLRRPQRWLHAIGRYGATTSGGPDFAYDLCTRKVALEEVRDVDLRSWRVAYNGAERVRAATLEAFSEKFGALGFARSAFYPCYGLAEATLFVTGGTPGAGPRVDRAGVSCGLPWLGTELAIVDPLGGTEVAPGDEGEIWIRGPAVARGYDREPELPGRFGATTTDGRAGFFRTGDLGRVSEHGLVVTGRWKDIIIVHGRNHHAVDIESAAERASSLVVAGSVVAFGTMDEDKERLVLVVELDRRHLHDLGELATVVRAGVAHAEEIHVDEIVVVRPGTIPRTSSGKPRRTACRALYMRGELDLSCRDVVLRRDLDDDAPAVPWSPARAQRVAGVRGFVVGWVTSRIAERDAGGVDGRTLASLGVDSLGALELGVAIEERFGVCIDATTVHHAMTVAKLVDAVADGWTAHHPAVPEVAAAGERPVTPAQREIWIADRISDEPGAYHVVLAARIEDTAVSTAALAGALRRLVANHDSLRTAFPVRDGEPIQRVEPVHEPDLGVIVADHEAAVSATIDAVAWQPFDVARGPLFRARIVTAPAGRWLVVVVHHLVADYWSAALLLNELGDLLASPDDVAPAPPVAAPAVRAPPRVAAELPITLDEATTGRVRAIARAHDTTPFVVVLAAYRRALARVLGEDVRIAIAIADRRTALQARAIESRARVVDLEGLASNSRGLAPDIAGIHVAVTRALREPGPRAAVLEAPRCVLSCQLLPPEVPATLLPLLLRLPDVVAAVGPLRLRSHPVRLGLPFATSLVLGLGGEVIRGWLRASDDLGEHRLRELGRAVLDVLAGSEELPLHARFEQIVDRSPDAIAVSFGQQHRTYRDLDAAANRIAHQLRAAGVRPEESVALIVERSVESIAGMLGILKAGAAYLPIDPSYPTAYRRRLLAGARVALTRERHVDGTPHGTSVLTFESIERAGGSAARGTPSAVSSACLAYVIYTSGSTGEPKGVQVTHRNVTRLIDRIDGVLGHAASDVWTCFHSTSFDFSVWEIWGALLAGARLVVVPDEVCRDPRALHGLLASERVTIFSTTPTVFRELERVDGHLTPLVALRRIVFGGEPLDGGSVARWFSRYGDAKPRLVNMYGITETTVHVTVRELTAADVQDGPPPIGGPIDDLVVYVLDGALAPVDDGAIGELYVGGAGVARGYLGRPDLTAGRFVPDPFARAPGARMYRTGDCVLASAPGELHFVGRLDDQVKLRGFRVELGEIEAALVLDPAVDAAAVVALRAEPPHRVGPGEREFRHGDASLVGYLTPRRGPIDLAELRRRLRSRLPAHLIPASLVEVDRLPRTVGGKLDRAALRDRPPPAVSAPAIAAGGAMETDHERVVAEIWSEILGTVPRHRDEDFFALGGDSIRALRVQARLAERGLAVATKDLFRRTVLRDLAQRLSPAAPPDRPHRRPFALVPPEHRAALALDRLDDAYPLTQLQAGLLFHTEVDPTLYRETFSYDVAGRFDPAAFHAAVARIVERHPVLRTTFAPDRGLQLVWRSSPPASKVVDVRDQHVRTAHHAASQVVLGGAPFVRVHAVWWREDQFRVVMEFHSALLDGWSVASLIAELLEDCALLADNPSAPRRPATHGAFVDYVAAEREAVGDPEARRFWSDRVEGLEPFRIGLEHAQGYDVQIVPVAIAAEVSQGLDDMARAIGVSIKHVLLAVHVRVLGFVTGRRVVVSGVETHARLDATEPDVLGLFLNTLPLRARSGEETWTELARAIRDAEAEAVPYRRFPYAEIQRLVGAGELFDVSFNYTHFHVFRRLTELADIELLGGDGIERTHFALKVELNRDPFDGRLQLDLEVDRRRIDDARIAALVEAYRRGLAEVAAAPDRRCGDAALADPASARMLERWASGAEIAAPVVRLEALVLEHAERTRDAVAVRDSGGAATYGDLADHSARIATALRHRGIGREDVVGVLLPRSADAVISILAVLRAGAVYLALDPADPSARLGALLRDASARVVITDRAHARGLGAGPWAVLELDEARATVASGLSAGLEVDDAAYVIYTSGSTGTPAGVVGTHRAMANRLAWQRQRFAFQPHDVAAYKTSARFVDSIAEMFAPLAAGIPLVAFSDEVVRDPERLVDELGATAVTHLVAVPSLLRAVLGAAPERIRALALRTCVSSGEPLSLELARRFREALPAVQLLNLYGTSEVAADVTFHVIDDAALAMASAVGGPIANVRVEVLGEDLRRVPPGVVGELYVCGVALARGYVARPALTAERFVPDPWSSELGARMYRTCDLARWTDHGQLELRGRTGRQIKFRGYRIEPAEIERALQAQPGVAEAVVVAQLGSGDDARLIGYVEPDGTGDVQATELRARLQEILPAYAVPARLHVVAGFPRVRSGKIDRELLGQSVSRAGALAISAATDTERAVAAVWHDVIGGGAQDVHASFFHDGGDSISAMRFVTAVRDRFGARLALAEFVRSPTIAAVATMLDRGPRAVGAGGSPQLRPAPEARFDPFPLTDVQQAYWVGRRAGIALGAVGSHLYVEIEGDLDRTRLEIALNTLIQRHEMLRTTVSDDGVQQTLRDVPWYRVAAAPDAERARADMAHQIFAPERWPLFDVRVSHLPGSSGRLHASIDLLIADAWSLQLLLRELFVLHRGASLPPPPQLSFRDYVVGHRRLVGAELEHRSRAYWWSRLDSLPAAPALPRVTRRDAVREPRFLRLEGRVEGAAWSRLKERARREQVTPTSVLATAFSEALALYAESRHFTLNLTLYNRLPVHPDVDRVVGDFTTLDLLVQDVRGDAAFLDRVRATQQQLWADLDHRHVSGIEVLRELVRRRGGGLQAEMPVVFTSTLDLHDGESVEWLPRELRLIEALTQTPQVTLDHQVREDGGALVVAWDVADGVFPDGLVEELLAAYLAVVRRLGDDDRAWGDDLGGWLAATAGERWARAQAVVAAVAPRRLEDAFVERAVERPAAEAIVADDRRLSYGELLDEADRLAGELHAHGVQRGDLVAIVALRGWRPLAAALGIVRAGAAYVPIDAEWPEARRAVVLRQARPAAVLADGQISGRSLRTDRADLDADLAYVIYTSGSTGDPKGVMVAHAAAWNTISAVNATWGVGSGDTVLAVSAQSFDLSVYDLFGLLAVGGRIVVPSEARWRDPAHWAELVQRHGVTIWNSVPALVDLLLDHVETAGRTMLHSLRLVLVSGDWVPVDLAARVRRIAGRHVTVIALGGATEAAIWSIAHELKDATAGARCVPYGRALPNQHVHVWDDELRERGTWAPGELFITGAGVALGYLEDPERTAERFLVHPRTGERVYRTGDIGRHLPDGQIELLGRRDDQVKIAGYRIELGDIEAALRGCDGVADAVAVATPRPSAREQRLSAFVVPVAAGLRADAVREALRAQLPAYMIPSTIELVDGFPLTANGKVDRGALVGRSGFAGGSATPVGSDGLVPRVAAIVAETLGRTGVPADADLLALGATSIDAARIANRLHRDLGFRPELRDIYRRPTIAALAELAAGAGAGEAEAPTRFDVDVDARRAVVCTTAPPRAIGAPVHLPSPSPAVSEHARRTHRRFAPEVVSALALAELLAPLRRDQAGRRAYASAGGLYTVRVYLHCKAGRVVGLERGLYTVDPGDHALLPVASDEPSRELHEPFVNRAVFDDAAFSVFLVGSIGDGRASYGAMARDFALIEAGQIAQLLADRAAGSGLGLCPIGYLDFAPVRSALRLGDDVELLHSLVGGVAVAASRLHAGDAPLSSAQRRIWFEDQLRPGGSRWTIIAAVRVEGPLDAPLLERCLANVVDRHESLRMTFHEVDGEPRQRVGAAPIPPLEPLDRAGIAPGDRAGDAVAMARLFAERLFDLGSGPLARSALLRYDPQDAVVVVLVHHLVADGWSMNLLLFEILELYAAAVAGRPSRLAPIRTRLVDHALWERRRAGAAEHRRAVDTWTRRLADAPPLMLPDERPRTGEPTLRGSIISRPVARDVVDTLERFAAMERASLFMVILAALQTVLYRRTGQRDLVVGAALANRARAELEAVVGCFVNLIAVRADLSGAPAVREVTLRTRDGWLAALGDGDVAFEDIVESLHPIRGLAGSGFLRVMLVVQNSPTVDVEVPGLRLERLTVDPGTTRFDLTVFADRTPDGMTLRIQYATDILADAAARRLLDELATVLTGWVACADRSIDEVPMQVLDPRPSGLRAARARPVRLSAIDLVEVMPLDPRQPEGPAELTPRISDLDPTAWASEARTWLSDQLTRRGALVLRGWLPPDVAQFRALIVSQERELVDDSGELPRAGLGDHLYTAVDYPPGEHILWHNENAFYAEWPARLWFLCVQVADHGGTTPTVDGRRMLARVDAAIVEELRSRGLVYVRTYGDGLGLDWRQVFRTTDRAAVDGRCAALGLRCEWRGDRLRTHSVRAAVVRHPATSDEVWFNQITHWHPHCLPPQARAALAGCPADELPRQVRFGDGGTIEPSFVDEICAAYRDLEVAHTWQPGDVLLVDNMLAGHARTPYVGRRRLAIAMAGKVREAGR